MILIAMIYETLDMRQVYSYVFDYTLFFYSL